MQNFVGISCWKAIAETRRLIIVNFTLVVYSGTCISFWHDKWIGVSPLSESFPEIYKLVRNKFASMSQLITTEVSWHFDLKRRLTDDETNHFAYMLQVIGDLPPILDGSNDTRRWSLSVDEVFSVKSCTTT